MKLFDEFGSFQIALVAAVFEKCHKLFIFSTWQLQNSLVSIATVCCYSSQIDLDLPSTDAE